MAGQMTTPKDREELREQLYDIRNEHWLRCHSRNLGQYRAEYDCACGEKLIEDGHSHDRHSNITLIHNRHIIDKEMELISAYTTRAVGEAEIRGRRIQAEATLDKWRSIPYAGESSAFPEFLYGQVDAWRYEAALPKDTGASN